MSGANGRALVVFSGGQDSTTFLYWAMDRFGPDRVVALTFDYGQRHRIELEAAAEVARFAGVPHVELPIDTFAALGGNALVDEQVAIDAPDSEVGELPSTFVPGRNLLFFTYAAAIAFRRGLTVLVGGMCETDYSGYPDCRDTTLKSLQASLNLGMDRAFVIETPLMWIDKAQTWAMAHALGGDTLTQIIRDDTHTCYLGDRETSHPWGKGCGTCPACELRASGWDSWKAHIL